ncbi:hypothetical protein HHK36_018895 [Tetracentron sinense]|uniref:Uncharacterized protein n=1 Tax=Tetracentron sinense TaxID=13715 RepID=A0A834Z086_TETSI|nr:hypothetical protein HHK36_018895 [Tetracentron sinense]
MSLERISSLSYLFHSLLIITFSIFSTYSLIRYLSARSKKGPNSLSFHLICPKTLQILRARSFDSLPFSVSFVLILIDPEFQLGEVFSIDDLRVCSDLGAAKVAQQAIPSKKELELLVLPSALCDSVDLRGFCA